MSLDDDVPVNELMAATSTSSGVFKRVWTGHDIMAFCREHPEWRRPYPWEAQPFDLDLNALVDTVRAFGTAAAGARTVVAAFSDVLAKSMMQVFASSAFDAVNKLLAAASEDQPRQEEGVDVGDQ